MFIQREIITLDFSKLKVGQDYKVISYTICDEEFNDYLRLESALRVNKMEQLIIDYDLIYPLIQSVYRFEKNKQDMVNIINAKMCGFGVLEFLNGEHKNIQYMFSICDEVTEEEMIIQLSAYSVLTHHYADEIILKKLKSSLSFRSYFREIMGLCTSTYYDCSNPFYYVMEEIFPNADPFQL